MLTVFDAALSSRYTMTSLAITTEALKMATRSMTCAKSLKNDELTGGWRSRSIDDHDEQVTLAKIKNVKMTFADFEICRRTASLRILLRDLNLLLKGQTFLMLISSGRIAKSIALEQSSSSATQPGLCKGWWGYDMLSVSHTAGSGVSPSNKFYISTSDLVAFWAV